MGPGCDSVGWQQSFLTLVWTQPQCLVVHNCRLSNIPTNTCSFSFLFSTVHNMASRRLDISSLLCDDNPPNFSPLDALVQAATEERRRLTVAEPSPRFLPLQGTLSPHYEEDQRIQRQRQQQHHDHILLQALHQPQQDVDQRHALDMDRRRRIQDAELQKRMEDQQRGQEFAVQRDRVFQFERRHDPYDRQREDHFRIQEADRQRDLAAAYQREIERARELDRQREIARQRELEHQRDVEKRERELREVERLRGIERQRDIDCQRDLELIQRRQQFHDSPRRFHDHPIPSPIITSPHPPSISHLISHPAPRKSDPGQIKPLNSPILTDPSLHHSKDDTRQVKKRRYSDSPTRPILNDKERIIREREKMAVGELGYGRIDSPIAGSSTAPRRPGSGHGQGRKSMPVSELLLDKPTPISQSDLRDRLVSPLGRRSPPGSQIGRAKAARKSDEHIHKEILLPPPPLPPSLSVELDMKKHKEETKAREMPKVKEEIRPREVVKFKEEPKSREGTKPREAKEDAKPTRHRVLQEDTQHKKAVTSAPIPVPPPPPPSKIQPPFKAAQDDAHEWFLQQYEDLSPTTSSRPEPPHSPSPSLSPATSTLPVYGPRSPPSQKILTPITAAVALEQELEELVSEPPPPPPPPTSSTPANKKQDSGDTDMDLDVDLAVTELVAETLDGEDVKHELEHLGMEVDVEDELLSLIDDRPVNNSISMIRRTSTSSSSQVTASGTGTSAKQPPPLRSVGDAPHTSPTISASSSTTLVSPAARHPSTRPTSERGSMPPPSTTNSAGVSKKSKERAGGAVPAKKKKEPGPKAKAAAAGTAPLPKPRAKPAAKGKKAAAAAAAAAENAVAATVIPPLQSTSKTTKATTKKTAPSTSRSRSTSVMPGGSAAPEGPDALKPEKQEEEEDSDAANDDDKLYCVCKTKYDEDRFMIACDKCDEWYHTQCVDMPELEVDLVDQFICPPCIEKNPHLNLCTTYKQRCLYGLLHPDPNSSKACHKAARGAFSKYCSDTCGVKYMQSRIDSWAKKGGKTDELWESVKDAEKREGVVVCAMENEVNGYVNGDGDYVSGDGVKMEVDSSNGDIVKSLKQHRIIPPTKTKVERETERLNALLESVMNLREEIKRGMEVVVWRERLLQLASERADQVGLCGWDQRLCFDDEEWAEIGAGVLESYKGLKEEGDDGEMDVDAGDEQWWCPGQKLCDRHAGWQTVRYKDVCKEREKKEEALSKLTTREREIRKRIEDMLDPQSRVSGETSRGTAKNPNPDLELARQYLKRKFKGSERGKKRKATS